MEQTEQKPIRTEDVLLIGSKPVNTYAMDASTRLWRNKKIRLKARGNAILIAISLSQFLVNKNPEMKVLGVKLGTDKVDWKPRSQDSTSPHQSTDNNDAVPSVPRQINLNTIEIVMILEEPEKKGE